MGVLINRKLLIKKSMIICAGLCSIAGITLNSVSMGTNFWIIASGKIRTVRVIVIAQVSSLIVFFSSVKLIDPAR